MKARCVNCQHVFPVVGTGNQTCPNCGTLLGLDLPGDSGAGSADASAPSSMGADGNCGIGGSYAGNGGANSGNSYGGGYFGSSNQPVERPTPWEERQEQGAFNSLCSTLSLSIKSPGIFFGRMPKDNAHGAITYFWAIGAVTTAVTLLVRLGLWYAAGPSHGASPLKQIMEAAGGTTTRGTAPLQWLADMLSYMPSVAAIEFLATFVIIFVPAVLFIPLTMLFQVAVLHICCLLLGAGKGGIRATLRAVGYSCGPLLMGVIPVCGSLMGAIVAFILLVAGISSIHGVGKLRAFFACALPYVLAIVVGFLLV